MATSYNGWEANPNPSAIGVVPFSVAGTRPFKDGGFPVGVKGGSVAVVFSYLVGRLHNEVEPMMVDPSTGLLGYGCWAFQYRANVNNPSTLSCHASGTAIDYNAPRHPNGTSVGANGGGGWTAAQVTKIRGILADLGGVVRWLTSNDPMHFEIAASSLAVDTVAARLGRVPEKPGNPGTPDTPNTEDDDMPYSPQDIKQFVHDGVKWALEDAASVDPVIVRTAVEAGVASVADVVRAEVAKLLPSAIRGNTDEHQAAKQIVHDGAKWAIEDPAVDVARFRG